VSRVLITGAAGRLGTILREGLRGRFDALRLLDVASLGPGQPGEELVTADVRDLFAVTDAMDGIDAVIHLAGIPHEDTFERILESNVVGTYHVFEAARRQGCARVVLASSLHVTGFYPAETRIGPDAPPRPDSFYGVGKAFGEALGRLYADKHGIEVLCLRIGTLAERPTTPRHLSTWLSPATQWNSSGAL
jgi:uronate dehydrogenase